MKVAICFSGLVRTFNECFPSYDKILDKYDCHLFGATIPNDVLKYHPFNSLVIQEDEWIEQTRYTSFQSPETVVQNALRQFKYIELANNARREYELQNGIKYDFIIRTRFDNIMVNDIPDLRTINPEAIYIPSGHDHPQLFPGRGINDRFAIGGDYVINIYSEKLKRVDDFMATGQRFHPETILKWILDTNSVQINRFDECTKINRGNNEFL